jgi:hypothetical protein
MPRNLNEIVRSWIQLLYSQVSFGRTKGVGPGMTLAWPGWKQSVIAVEVDTGRLENSRFKKCYANCLLLYFPSTEIKSAFNVYWHGGGAAGLSCTELSIWEFPFLRGVCWQGWTSIWYCEKGMPQKDTLNNLGTPVCFRIPSSSFTSVSIFSVSCYSIVSISVGRTSYERQYEHSCTFIWQTNCGILKS